MSGRSKWLSIALVVAVASIGLSASAGADSGSEQAFLSAINSTRGANGLAPLQMDGNLRSYARKHSADMAAAGEIYHSSSAELQGAAGSGWSKLGENVGRGGSVSGLHQAFLDSPAHRANILGDYNYVGIGTDTSTGPLYVTVVFMKKGATSPPPAPTTTTPKTTNTTKASSTKASPAKPAAAPTTTPTTTPSTTTTTLIVGPDKPVTPGESCLTATRFGWMCHD
jgi:hypothetical protein